MNTDAIEKAFAEMISKKGIDKEIGISYSYLTTLRHKLKHGIAISLEKKIELLQKSGWQQNEASYTRKDLVEAIRFALKQGKAAKEHGPEYILEKFLSSKKPYSDTITIYVPLNPKVFGKKN